MLQEKTNSARQTRQFVAMFGFGGTLMELLVSRMLHWSLAVIAGAAAGAVVGFVFAGDRQKYTQ